MFVIRKEMMAAFEAQMREQFVLKAIAQLEEVFPEAAQRQGAPALRKLVEAGMEQAAGYGVLGEREVLLFIDLMMELGANFLEVPRYKWIRATLEKQDFNEQQKMDMIYERLKTTT